MADNESSFDERLREARERHAKAQPAAPPAGVGNASPLGVGVRVGAELVAALVVAVAIGWFLDRWLGTTPWLTSVFTLLGGAAGVANVWRLMMPPKRRES